MASKELTTSSGNMLLTTSSDAGERAYDAFLDAGRCLQSSDSLQSRDSAPSTADKLTTFGGLIGAACGVASLFQRDQHNDNFDFNISNYCEGSNLIPRYRGYSGCNPSVNEFCPPLTFGESGSLAQQQSGSFGSGDEVSVAFTIGTSQSSTPIILWYKLFGGTVRWAPIAFQISNDYHSFEDFIGNNIGDKYDDMICMEYTPSNSGFPFKIFTNTVKHHAAQCYITFTQ